MIAVNELLTVPEASAYLKISPWTLRHWMGAGKIRCVKMNGGVVRLRRRDLERFVEQNLVKTHADGNEKP